MAEVVQIGALLLSALTDISTRFGEKLENDKVKEELKSFLQFVTSNVQLLKQPILSHGGQHSAKALDSLKQDLEKAEKEARKISNLSTWNSKKIGRELEALRQRLVNSFQINLALITLDAVIQGNEEKEEWKRAMEEANKSKWALIRRETMVQEGHGGTTLFTPTRNSKKKKTQTTTCLSSLSQNGHGRATLWAPTKKKTQTTISVCRSCHFPKCE